MNTFDIKHAIHSARMLTILITGALLFCAQPAQAAETVKSIDQVTGGIRNPDMKRRWEEAYRNGKLPPLNTLPVPQTPVSRRQRESLAGVEPIALKRPVIPSGVPIDVQFYTLDRSLTSYQGPFRFESRRDGILRGRLDGREQPFEILYRLPRKASIDEIDSNSKLQLDYFDDVADSALQRRLVLYDPEKGAPKLITISEGSLEPYTAQLKAIDLSIQQRINGDNGRNPPVTVNYRGKTITLRRGETTSIDSDTTTLRVHLLNSYAHQPKQEFLLEGQPYYLSIILYESSRDR